MAEDRDDQDKTEEPSQYRLEEFRKKGEVASSKELTNVLLLSGCFLSLILSGIYIFEIFSEYIEWLYLQDSSKIYGKVELQRWFEVSAIFLVKSIAPVCFSAFSLGILSQIMQVGFIFSPEVLNVKFTRINPLNGIKKLFSAKSLVEAVKGTFKFAIVIFITYYMLKNNVSSFIGFLHADAMESLGFGKILLIKLGFSVLLGLGIVAMGDFAWEKYSYHQKLKMSKQEVKDESKEKDGNPEIKNRIRQIQRQMAQKRMMNDVKKADVIVTNPTHISVALRYDVEKMVAPQVMAIGVDHLALKIRELAKEANIPIVENIPLARGLYKTVKVGEGVPRNLYKAVAEVLAFVYKIKRKNKALT